MDIVAITDHDRSRRPYHRAPADVVIGCEVTAAFPSDNVRVHLGVLGIDEAQHREIQRCVTTSRADAVLRREEIFRP